ncbi:MAG: hypothetical protein DHS20C16_09630 [Phycisphaerae bacterium]|nr:MAG: hypothetical protein DHS20C16_09630 [Phycisphaerae bacterium]
MHMKSLTTLFGLTVLAFGIVPSTFGHCGACGHGSDAKKADTKDIVDTAVAAGNFNTLVAAAKAAGLVETLKSDGPLTVFAPTDEAFAKLPAGTVEKLLADPDRLGAILKYHVVPGKVMAADVVKLSSAQTVLGQSLDINSSSGVKVGAANVVSTDIETSNGVIHVIDTVLLPKNDIVEVARAAGSFKTLLTALEAAGLTSALRDAGPFTVFAPTDAAFAKLPKGTVEGLLKDTEKLKAILTYHVVSGEVLAKDVVKLSEAGTLQGQSVKVSAANGVKINDATVLKTDVKAENGVIHVIDSVLIPSEGGQANADQDLIRRAIYHGATLYNDGHHAACAAVYEIAAMGLLANSDQSINNHNRNQLRAALASIQQSHDSRNNAWVMRHALDDVYASASN